MFHGMSRAFIDIVSYHFLEARHVDEAKGEKAFTDTPRDADSLILASTMPLSAPHFPDR